LDREQNKSTEHIVDKPTKSDPSKPLTRIQLRNRAKIMDAALHVFAQHGFRGATLDMIAKQAGLSKPNLLYYFPSKESVHTELVRQMLNTWQDPLLALDPNGEPLDEILNYVRKKLALSREFPKESRLFANEIIQGAPRLKPALEGELKQIVDDKAKVIGGWMKQGKLKPLHPHHLIFSIWSLTQHYADFDVQVRAVLGEEDPFEAADGFLETTFRRMLTPD